MSLRGDPCGQRPYFVPTTARTGRAQRASLDARVNASHTAGPDGHGFGTYTLFEGISEVQRLVMARAASGMHIHAGRSGRRVGSSAPELERGEQGHDGRDRGTDDGGDIESVGKGESSGAEEGVTQLR
jgi:hypothetical protein